MGASLYCILPTLVILQAMGASLYFILPTLVILQAMGASQLYSAHTSYIVSHELFSIALLSQQSQCLSCIILRCNLPTLSAVVYLYPLYYTRINHIISRRLDYIIFRQHQSQSQLWVRIHCILPTPVLMLVMESSPLHSTHICPSASNGIFSTAFYPHLSQCQSWVPLQSQYTRTLMTRSANVSLDACPRQDEQKQQDLSYSLHLTSLRGGINTWSIFVIRMGLNSIKVVAYSPGRYASVYATRFHV